MWATSHPHPANPQVDLQSFTAVIHSDCRSEQKHFKNSNKKKGRMQILKTTCLQKRDGLLWRVKLSGVSKVPLLHNEWTVAASSVCWVKTRARLVTESWQHAARLRRCVISSRRWWIACGQELSSLENCRSLAFHFTVDSRSRGFCVTVEPDLNVQTKALN